jgi:uncharacterized membrane protein
MKTNQKIVALCRAAMIAALYTALTWLCGLLGLASGSIQLRFAEALCILPFFMPEAIWGLTIGCFLSNLLVSGGIWADVIFGTLATLIGALGTYAMRRLKGKARFLCMLPPILANTIIIPFVLRYAYILEQAWWLMVGGVAVGEILSVGVLGTFLMLNLERRSFWKIK